MYSQIVCKPTITHYVKTCIILYELFTKRTFLCSPSNEMSQVCRISLHFLFLTIKTFKKCVKFEPEYLFLTDKEEISYLTLRNEQDE